MHWYLVVLLPVLSRTLLVFRHWQRMDEAVPVAAQNRSEARSIILAMAGFSFTGAIAIFLLDSSLARNYNLAAFYLYLSFVAFLVSLSSQSYAATRLARQAAEAFVEMGVLSMLLAFAAILKAQSFNPRFSAGLCVTSVLLWLIDHSARIYIENRSLRVLVDRVAVGGTEGT